MPSRRSPIFPALVTLLLVGWLCSLAAPGEAALGRTRAEWQRALRRVSESVKSEVPLPPGTPDNLGADFEGMYAGEVLRVLGLPDAVLMESEEAEALRALGVPDDVAVGGDESDRIVSWCYGTSGPGTVPTLGRVWFNQRGRVSRVAGSCPQPAPLALKGVPESRLRDLLRLLGALPEPVFTWSRYDPLPLIRAVNALQPLGKEKALAVIGECLRVGVVALNAYQFTYGDDSHHLRPLLSVLFSIPETSDHAPGILGAQVQDGVPFLLRGLGGIGGSIAFSFDELEKFGKHGRFLAAPLRPPANPPGIVDRIAYPDDVSPEVQAGMRQVAMNQLLRLIDPVYPTSPDRNGNRIAPGDDLEQRWQKIVREVDQIPLRWDARRQSYVRDAGAEQKARPTTRRSR